MTDTTSRTERDDLDPARIIETLERHDVIYLLVGGLGAAAHGATRPTSDFDCVVERSNDNLDRLADALNELGAFYRVGGLTNDEARAMPTTIDRHTLANAAISTWRTNAGDLDVMTELAVADGVRRSYDDLLDASTHARLGGDSVRIAALNDIIASKHHANRSKDQAALPELDRLAQRQQQDLHNDVDID